MYTMNKLLKTHKCNKQNKNNKEHFTLNLDSVNYILKRRRESRDENENTEKKTTATTKN